MTLRALEPAAVIDAAAAAGLESIEWGSDVHVPAGDTARAAAIGQATREAGLAVASYGSYLGCPWVNDPPEEPAAVIASALALGAPRIRVWAGPVGSADADAATRAATVAMLAQIADAASAAGLGLALEFHRGTLTDTADSTMRLLAEVDRPTVSTYWQPRVEARQEQALADLDVLAERVSTLHVFSWDEHAGRHPLAERESLWRAACARAATLPAVTDLLLEFLPDDDVRLLAGEAAQLRRYRVGD